MREGRVRYMNVPAIIKRLRVIEKNPRMYGPNEVAVLCGVAADALAVQFAKEMCTRQGDDVQ